MFFGGFYSRKEINKIIIPRDSKNFARCLFLNSLCTRKTNVTQTIINIDQSITLLS